jgi:anti-sigma factor RsiW
MKILPELISGELSDAVTDQAMSHIGQCRACAEEEEKLRAAISLLAKPRKQVLVPSALDTLELPSPAQAFRLRPVPASLGLAAALTLALILWPHHTIREGNRIIQHSHPVTVAQSVSAPPTHKVTSAKIRPIGKLPDVCRVAITHRTGKKRIRKAQFKTALGQTVSVGVDEPPVNTKVSGTQNEPPVNAHPVETRNEPPSKASKIEVTVTDFATGTVTVSRKYSDENGHETKIEASSVTATQPDMGT